MPPPVPPPDPRPRPGPRPEPIPVPLPVPTPPPGPWTSRRTGRHAASRQSNLLEKTRGQRLRVEHDRWERGHVLDGRRGSRRTGRCWRLLSHPKGHRIRAYALGATDWLRLLITSATTALPRPLQFGREKHEMPNVSSRLVGDRSGSPTLMPAPSWSSRPRWRRGSDAARPTPRAGSEGPTGDGATAAARRARVEMEHDERSRKADTEGTVIRGFIAIRRNRASPCPIPGQSHRPGSAAITMRCGQIPRRVDKSRADGPSVKPRRCVDCVRRAADLRGAGRTHEEGARYPSKPGGPASADSCAPRRISRASSSRHDPDPSDPHGADAVPLHPAEHRTGHLLNAGISAPMLAGGARLTRWRIARGSGSPFADSRGSCRSRLGWRESRTHQTGRPPSEAQSMAAQRPPITVILLAATTFATSLLAQSSITGLSQAPPPLLLDSNHGTRLIQVLLRAMSRHGRPRRRADRAALRTRPTDLASLARRNGGSFSKGSRARRCHRRRPPGGRAWPATCPMGPGLPRARSFRAPRQAAHSEHRHARRVIAGAACQGGRPRRKAVQDALCDLPRGQRPRQRTARRSTPAHTAGPDEVHGEEWRPVSGRAPASHHRRPRRAVSRRP